MPRLRIVVDPELCIGAASCITVAPSFFKLTDQNKAMVLDPNVPEDPTVFERVLEVSERTKDNLILAAESCPTLAISVYDADTGQKLFPRN